MNSNDRWQDARQSVLISHKAPILADIQELKESTVFQPSMVGLTEADFGRALQQRESAVRQIDILERKLENVKARTDEVALCFVLGLVTNAAKDLDDDARLAISRILGRLGVETKDASTPKRRATAEKRRPQIDRVVIRDSLGTIKREYTGGTRGINEFIREFAEQAGLSLEFGVANSVWRKGRRRIKAPLQGTIAHEMSIQEWDNAWQEYNCRVGKCEPGYPDYVIACAILDTYERIEYLSKDGKVVAYHRRDGDGNVYCSDDGYGASEESMTL